MSKIKIDAKFIARTAIFAAISIILYCVPFLKFSLPIFPQFLEIHLDEIPALIAGFAYGPLSGLFVIILKTIVKLPMSNTACVGELADFIYSFAFIVPATLIYKKKHTFKGAIVSILIGIGIQVITACFVTTYLMLDFYIFMFGFTEADILGMCQAINPAVTSLGMPFLLMVALPFNLLKDAVVGTVTILVYKKLHKLIDRIGGRKEVEPTQEKEQEKN